MLFWQSGGEKKRDSFHHHAKCCKGEKSTSSTKMCTDMNYEVIKTLSSSHNCYEEQ